MNIGSAIRKLRVERNLTQEYIAAKMNISVTAYGNIERNDVKRLTIARLKEIADVLGVHFFELFNEEREIFFRRERELLHTSLCLLKDISESLKQQLKKKGRKTKNQR